MRITDISTHPPAGLLRIITDTPHEGWCPDVPADAQAMIPALYRAALTGQDPVNRERIWQALAGVDRTHHTALRGYVDAALWDLAAKAVGLPVYRYIGGFRSRVPAYKRGTPDLDREPVVQEALRAREEGFFGYKITCALSPGTMRRLIRELRQWVGPDFYLLLDGGQRYSIVDAIKIGRAFDEAGGCVFDQPRPDGDFAGLKQVADAIDTPVTAGVAAPIEASQALSAGAGDLLRAGTPACGGITDALKIARCAEAFGVHLHLAGTGMACGFAHAHLLGALKHVPFFEADRSGVQDASPLIRNPLRVENGYLHLPAGPGLGLEIDEGSFHDH